MRRFLRLIAVILPVLFAIPASAADYPNRPVKFIVPFGAGGPADIYARVLAQHLSEQTKQSFLVEDRPGAGSLIGTDAVAKSAPDGYTLLIMSNTHTTNESLLPNKPFKLMTDFVPVASINYSDLVMVVPTSLPVKSVKEFIDMAKKDPGKLNYASSGPGTPYHMAGELFKSMAGIDVVHVPYKASGDARNAVLLAGFQAAGSRGRWLAEGAKTVKIHGEFIPVRAEVVELHQLSAHAGQGELLRWLNGFQAPPRKTFLVHGEPPGLNALAGLIRQRVNWPVEIAHYAETVELV